MAGVSAGGAFLPLAIASRPTAAGRIEFTASGNFSETAVRRGVRATREQCQPLDDAVWVSAPPDDAGADGECLRYFTARIGTGGARRVIVYFAGDVWTADGQLEPGYSALDIPRIRAGVERWAERLDAPYVFFARPGTFGSSGDHMQRRRRAESKLVSAALDALKRKLGIAEFVLVGHSGGGHVVASLLTQRDDIVCAVPASSPSSPSLRWRLQGATHDTTGYVDSYEPVDHLRRGSMHPKLRVLVLGDPNDTNVPWASQQILADRLQDAGIAHAVLNGIGRGPSRHSLADSGRIVAGWCYHDVPTDEIVRRAAKGLGG